MKLLHFHLSMPLVTVDNCCVVTACCCCDNVLDRRTSYFYVCSIFMANSTDALAFPFLLRSDVKLKALNVHA